jgi:hypothetical protein
MTPEEKAEMDVLCKQIVEEKDRNKFLALVLQLNNLLERKESRLQGFSGASRPESSLQE